MLVLVWVLVLGLTPPPTGSEAWRLYEYIVRHFLATISEDCRYLQTSISFSVASEGFTCSGRTLLSPGAPPPPPSTLLHLNLSSSSTLLLHLSPPPAPSPTLLSVLLLHLLCC